MKTHKIILLSLMLTTSFVGYASYNLNKQSSQDENSVVAKMIGYSLLAPVFAVQLGCERRTLTKMEEGTKSQLTPEQTQTFDQNYTENKVDTKLYTTATGPLALLTIIGGVLATTHPAGWIVMGVGAISNCGALLIAEQAQKHNMDVYEKTLQTINTARAVDKLPPVNGYKNTSTFQKLFCIGKGRA